MQILGRLLNGLSNLNLHTRSGTLVPKSKHGSINNRESVFATHRLVFLRPYINVVFPPTHTHSALNVHNRVTIHLSTYSTLCSIDNTKLWLNVKYRYFLDAAQCRGFAKHLWTYNEKNMLLHWGGCFTDSRILILYHLTAHTFPFRGCRRSLSHANLLPGGFGSAYLRGVVVSIWSTHRPHGRDGAGLAVSTRRPESRLLQPAGERTNTSASAPRPGPDGGRCAHPGCSSGDLDMEEPAVRCAACMN